MQPGPGTRSIQLTGPLGSAALPPICANCAHPSAGHAVVESVFRRSGTDSPDVYLVGRMYAPFCHACRQKHDAERPPIRFFDRALMMFRTSEVLSGLAPAATALFILYIALPRFLRFDVISVAVFGGLAGFFFFIAYWGFKAAWEKSEQYAVRPPSSVTSSVTFTDDISELFEPERRIYTMRNPQFADAFIELNRQRMWRPDGRTARVAKHKRKLAYIGFGILAGAAVIYGMLKDFGLLP